MDPDATLTRIEDALTAGAGAELRDACADLLAWLLRGGARCTRQPRTWDGAYHGAGMWEMRGNMLRGDHTRVVLRRYTGMYRTLRSEAVVWERD